MHFIIQMGKIKILPIKFGYHIYSISVATRIVKNIVNMNFWVEFTETKIAIFPSLLKKKKYSPELSLQ